MNKHVYNICMLLGLVLTGVGFGIAFGMGIGLAVAGLLLIVLTAAGARLAGRASEG